MDSAVYFYEQTQYHKFPKRLRKIQDDLPDNLKYAHLNPKAAAILASKEKQKLEEDQIKEGQGRKSLLPEINQAFHKVKNQLDASALNEDDSQWYLFEQAKLSSESILLQLSRYIYYYENIASHIPRSLEYQMMAGYSELTSDVQVKFRQWQTQASREAYIRQLIEGQNTDGQNKGTSSVNEDNCFPRNQSQISVAGHSKRKKSPRKLVTGLSEIIEDGESIARTDRQNFKLNDGSFSQTQRLGVPSSDLPCTICLYPVVSPSDNLGMNFTSGKISRMKRGPSEFDNTSTVTASEIRSTAMANSSYYMSVIQFQLSSKTCEEKGWIHQRGNEEGLSKEAILEYCVQHLQQVLKNIKHQRAHEAQLGFTSQVVVRYYGDSHKETLLKYRKLPSKSTSSLMKDGKPCIPEILDDLTDGRQLMLTTHVDGTTVAYYPSGRPAVVASAAGINRQGFYTIAYDDDSNMRMVAVFTPSGKGVCYHTNGNIKLLLTKKGGHIANQNGRVTRRWKWPQAQVKLLSPVQCQLNQHLSFRCVAENNSALVFTCQKETARFFVNAASVTSNKKRDENDHILTDFKFSSNAAKELLKLHPRKSKSRSKKKRDKLTKQLAELVKSVDNQEKLLYDLESDKEHARLQRKARNLIDDWLEHYRITIGLRSPTLTQLSESPRKSHRGALSAKTAERKDERSGSFGISEKESVIGTARTPSAPAKSSGRTADNIFVLEQTTSENCVSTISFYQSAQGEEQTQKLGGGIEEENGRHVSSAITEKLIHLSEMRNKSLNAQTKSAVSRQSTNVSVTDRENMITSLNLCPAALRKQLLSNISSQCHCSREIIPHIMDVEYETYINEMAPANQLQVIAVVSSLHPQTNLAEPMLNELYENQNHNRTQPCPQSRSDMFRMLRYDINTATEGTDRTQPYLLNQHNVAPGMFLIYGGGHLLFCDHIFNGYGNAKRDFKKQVMQSKLDFLRGFSLPKDFRFSPSHGLHGLRSPWGGEIGGTGVDYFVSPDTMMDNSKQCTPKSQNGNIRVMCKHIGELINLQETTTSERSSIPQLPPINHLSSQKPGHSQPHKLESVS